MTELPEELPDEVSPANPMHRDRRVAEIARRRQVRCECSHGRLLHPDGLRCYGSMFRDGEKLIFGEACSCLEFTEAEERRGVSR